jgi:hypothetical protein
VRAPVSARLRAAGFLVLTVLLAAHLFVPAAALSFRPGPIAEFRGTGLPDWLRRLLAWLEMAGAILFVIPPSFKWGAAILVPTLCSAIALHAFLGARTGTLSASLALLLLLCVTRGSALSSRAQ